MSMPGSASQESAQAWWGRNWKWVVPVGCLVPIALVLLLFVTVFSFMKSSVPYRQALDSARVNCAVQNALGTPIAPGRFVSGSINVNGPSGTAELSIPLQGSRTSGTLYVTATKAAGLWRFDLLQVAVPGRSERIDLLAKTGETCN
jgi:Cytochrome oxidase complex assembly protein 1